MDTQSKLISTTTLERVEEQGGTGNNGNETLSVELTYLKDARPGRGYYLHVITYRQLDNGCMQMDIFRHPRKSVLLLPAARFSASVLAKLAVDEAIVRQVTEEVTLAHTAYRDKQKQDAAKYATV